MLFLKEKLFALKRDTSHTMKNKKFLRFTFGVLFFFLILSSFVVFSNLHFHICYVFFIVYGHPYDKTDGNNSPFSSHSHSSLGFLHYFSSFTFEIFIFLFFTIIFFAKLLNYIRNQFEQLFYHNPFILITSLRAPPTA